MAGDTVLSDRLLRTIGLIVVYHAEVEHWIDAMVYYLHTHLPGTQQFSKKTPTNFTREIEFLRSCFTKMPAMKPLRLQGVRLLDRIEKTHEDRSHVVHGYLRAWDKKTRRLAFMRVWKPPKGEPQIVIASVREATLSADAKRLDALRHTVRKFSLRVGKICLPKKDPEEALAGLGR